ncbi:MAG: hypothetical protein EA422_07590 [Gemmatimonadales bacterium]|nr:MAG: hypothetical protein EA422_07590 [Gemmatimonadales bacterium]
MRARTLVLPLVAGIFAVTAACDSETTMQPEPQNEASVLASTGEDLMAQAMSSGDFTGNFIVSANSNFIRRNLAGLVSGMGGTILFQHEPTGFALIGGISGEAADQLASTNGVNLVEPETMVELESQIMAEADAAVLSDGAILNDNPAGAFFFARQWHLNAISAPQVWESGQTGSADITVAILDTGIDYTHLDLQGLVDLDRSVSFLPQDDAFVQQFFPGAHPIADLNFHGTHVAATVSSNALAAAGVTSKTTLVGVKVCNVEGRCPTGAVLAGMLYAADAGADVINMSLGGLFLKSANPGFVSLINNVANYVRQQGALLTIAAGNSAVDLNRNLIPQEDGSDFRAPSLFASYCNATGVFCVSATGPEAAGGINGPWLNVDAVAPYTNFGSAVNAAAPGGAAAPVWAACSRFSLQIPQCQTGFFVIGVSGTSMAAPHAAGVAALIKANNPGFNSAQLGRALERSADRIDGNGRSPFYGQGRINAARAVGL